MSGHNHPEGEKCFICAGASMEDLSRWQDEQLEKHGFYMHMVGGPEGFVNAHTHGFQKTWGHTDFQIVLNVGQKTISSIFWEFADRVKAGEVFHGGMLVDKIIKKYAVKLDQNTETGRDVLRVLLPDADGRFPGDSGVAGYFADQAGVVVDGPETDDHHNMN